MIRIRLRNAEGECCFEISTTEDNSTKNSEHFFFCSRHELNDFDPVAVLLNRSALWHPEIVFAWNQRQKLAQFSLIDAFGRKYFAKKCPQWQYTLFETFALKFVDFSFFDIEFVTKSI